MADYSVTAASVVPSAGGTINYGTAGEAITAGQAVYRDTADSNKIKVADCTDADKINVAGIAVCDVATGQKVAYDVSDTELEIGATVAVGDVIVLSESGGLAPVADLTTDDYAVVLGVAVSTSAMTCHFVDPAPLSSGAVIA